MNKIPALKTTTGLTGLKVAVNPEHHLRILYNKILRIMKKIPPDAAYRKYTETLVKERLQCVVDLEKMFDQYMREKLRKIVRVEGQRKTEGKSKSPLEVEQKINSGQAEELILQAERELAFARSALVWKPWEPLIETPPPGQWSWPPTN